MGNSLTNFDGYAFWEKDQIIMTWLCLMVRQMDRSGELSPYQREIREHYVIHGTVFFGGAQSPSLDEFIDTPKKRDWLLALSLDAREELKAQGTYLSADWLNALERMDGTKSEGNDYDKQIEAAHHFAYAENWIALLKGNPEVLDEPSYSQIHIDYYGPDGVNTGGKGYPRR